MSTKVILSHYQQREYCHIISKGYVITLSTKVILSQYLVSNDAPEMMKIKDSDTIQPYVKAAAAVWKRVHGPKSV